MKAVLISIRLKYVSLIRSGKKTIEIRKTKPANINVPFKCYIYQTLPKYGDINNFDGKVVGEFICNKIEQIDLQSAVNYNLCKKSCLSYSDLIEYAKNKINLYGWCITDVKMYDTPKRLDEFYKWTGDKDIRPCQNSKHCNEEYYDYSEDVRACRIDFDGDNCPFLRVQRPPQSWQYIDIN